ncbi:hypothetical protein BDR22DRAFT_974749 [Usnea florida]
MAHELPDSRHRNFGYPRVYTNSVSAFDVPQGTAPMENTEPEPSRSRYPYYSPYATASFTPCPGAFSYHDEVNENAPTRNASVTLPTLLPDYSHPAPPTFTGHELSSRNIVDMTPTVQKRSARGVTGEFVCDECGHKFTKKSSLNRHSKVYHGKTLPRKQSRAQTKSMGTKGVGLHSDNTTDAMSIQLQPKPMETEGGGFHPNDTTDAMSVQLLAHLKSMETKGGGFHSDNTTNAMSVQLQSQPTSMETKGGGFYSNNNTGAMSVTKTHRNQQDNNDQYSGYNGNLETTLAENTRIEAQGPSKTSSVSKSTKPMSYQWPRGTEPYVPQGPDTSEGHTQFRCDLCPVVVARRDILQMHKAQVHGMTESPFFPESGSVNMPPYLEGVTLENSTGHSWRAFRVFQGGALSSSPCQPCMSRGIDCIVSPFLSSQCARCNFNDNGSYCGAAGVRYRKPRGVIDVPKVTTTNSNNYTQPMEQRPTQAVPEAPYPVVPSRPKEDQHSRISFMDHSVSTSPKAGYYASSS